MKKEKVLILENDVNLDASRHTFIFDFLETYKGEVIDFSGLHMKKPAEIWQAVNECTDIFTQTCFVNGSELQFDSFVELLGTIKEPKNVYIALLNVRKNELFDFIDGRLSDEELANIKQHNIFNVEHDFVGEDKLKIEKLDFSERVNKYLLAESEKEKYRNTSKHRTTGRKIRILACNASGKAFSGLQIGAEVDELDMSEQDEHSERGVWIWGNGEPIKLVNDCGLTEYKVVSKMTADEILEEVLKLFGVTVELKRIEEIGLLEVIKDKEAGAMEKANFLCEELNVPKRGNRQKIYELLQ